MLHADRIEFERYETDLRQLITDSADTFVRTEPVAADAGIEEEPEQHGHVAVYKDFHRAIREDASRAANGEEGRKSLELANAMIYSGATGEAVNLPWIGRRTASCCRGCRRRMRRAYSEADACRPISVEASASNRKAVLPYGLTTSHCEQQFRISAVPGLYQSTALWAGTFSARELSDACEFQQHRRGIYKRDSSPILFHIGEKPIS